MPRPYPCPDWQKNRLYLVDPAIWPEYRSARCDLRPVYSALVEALTSLGIEHRSLGTRDDPVDIWIRDWGPVENYYFRFQPGYAQNVYSRRAVARARRGLSAHLDFSPRRLPLVLDGGNLVHNGQVAILTEKVLRDNSHLSKQEVENAIISLGFERVVFIPVEPADQVGHADGILRFVSPEMLLVNDYTGSDLRRYQRQLFTCLQHAKLTAELIPFPWFSTGNIRGTVWSATGVYINFIHMAEGLVVPAFGHPRDDCAVQCLGAHTSRPIRSVRATALARLGGVLNYISLTL